ncbi:MAG: WbqC family protein [Verrucomicrobiota bacterium]
MKLAAMQPYAFPYLGYFQLVAAVDKFVLLDDADFISQGWVNRNRILAKGEPLLLTIPLRHASSNRSIRDHDIAFEDRNWEKLPRLIREHYQRAPMFEAVWPILAKLFATTDRNLARFIEKALREMMQYLELQTEIIVSSRSYTNSHLKSAARLVDICATEGADTYLNAEGGRMLYSTDDFKPHGIDLEFLSHVPLPYLQFSGPFVERLSVIDVLMFCDSGRLVEQLASFRIDAAQRPPLPSPDGTG